MHRSAFVTIGLVILTACAPMATPPMNDNPSSVTVIDTATGDLEITPEPFAEPTEPTTITGSALDVEESRAGGMLSIGNASARLTMTVFLHPSSPYSQEFMRLRMPMLLQEFVEPGKLKILLALLPIEKYAGTEDAGKTMMCGLDQNKGYETFAALFDTGQTTLTDNNITALALDPTLFRTCVSTMNGDTLAGSRSAASNWGITLVPSYVIDGETFIGLPSLADLRGSINAAL